MIINQLNCRQEIKVYPPLFRTEVIHQERSSNGHESPLRVFIINRQLCTRGRTGPQTTPPITRTSAEIDPKRRRFSDRSGEEGREAKKEKRKLSKQNKEKPNWLTWKVPNLSIRTRSSTARWTATVTSRSSTTIRPMPKTSHEVSTYTNRSGTTSYYKPYFSFLKNWYFIV